MPLYDFSSGATSGKEIAKIFDFAAGATSGTQIGEIYDFAAGATSGSLIYKSEIVLLDNTNGNTWTLSGKTDQTSGQLLVESNGSILMAPGTWISSWGAIYSAYKKMSDCNSVNKVTIIYSNSKNEFNSAATYIGIRRGSSGSYYYQGNVPDAVKMSNGLGGSAHSNATLTFTFDSPTDLSSCYLYAACTTQGADIKPWLRLHSVIVE